MSKGFKLTLLTVAVACMGMRAMAMAPVINDIPSPIVSDEEGATQIGGLGNNDFVYPDAFNPDTYASDSDGPNADLVYSYEAIDDKYTLNGVARLNGDDPVDPSASGKDIVADADAAEVNIDANDATVTIRNEDLSPLGAANNGDPAGDGILPSETRIITLVASDGASTTEEDFVVYTEDNGTDRISGADEGTEVLNFQPAGSNGAPWLFFDEFAAFGTVTSSVSDALCMESTATGANGAEWYSPYGEPGGVDLVANSIYRFRFEFSTTQTTSGLTPLFSVIVDNSDPNDAFGALNLYNNENFRLDNLGGANAPEAASFGELVHDFYFTPAPVQAAEWNNVSTGIFSAGMDAVNDMRIRYRIFDFDNQGWGGESDLGKICMDSVVVNRFPWSSRTVTGTPFDAQALVDGSAGATAAEPNKWTVSGLAGLNASTVAFSGGDVTVTPTDGNYEVEIGSFFPGDTNNPLQSGGAAIADNYPVAWPSDAIYEVVAGVSAPNQASEDNPVDLFRLGMDSPTQEVITLNVVTAGGNGVGMPELGVTELYYSLVHTGQTTLSSTNNHNRLRPRADFICSQSANFNGETQNEGGLTVHGFTVNQVTIGN